MNIIRQLLKNRLFTLSGIALGLFLIFSNTSTSYSLCSTDCLTKKALTAHEKLDADIKAGNQAQARRDYEKFWALERKISSQNSSDLAAKDPTKK